MAPIRRYWGEATRLTLCCIAVYCFATWQREWDYVYGQSASEAPDQKSASEAPVDKRAMALTATASSRFSSKGPDHDGVAPLLKSSLRHLFTAARAYEARPLLELNGVAAGEREPLTPCWWEGGEEDPDAQGRERELHCMAGYNLLGVPKCGTSVLFACIDLHPLTVAPFTKETHFWRVAWSSENSWPGFPDADAWRRNHTRRNALQFAEKAQRATPEDWLRLALGEFTPENFARWSNRMARREDGTLVPKWELRYPDGWPSALRGKLVQPQALHAVQPGIPIVVIFRDPATRAASQYGNDCHPCHMQPAESRETFCKAACPLSAESFGSLVNLTLPLLRDCFAEQAGMDSNFCSLLVGSYAERMSINNRAIEAAGVDRRWLQWLQEGLYSEFLRIWLALYGPEKVMAVRYEDLIESPREVLTAVFNHVGLGVDAMDEELWQRMEAKVSKGRTPVGGDAGGQQAGEQGRSLLQGKTYRQLSEFYAPFNKDLAELTGNDRFLLWGTEKRETR